MSLAILYAPFFPCLFSPPHLPCPLSVPVLVSSQINNPPSLFFSYWSQFCYFVVKFGICGAISWVITIFSAVVDMVTLVPLTLQVLLPQRSIKLPVKFGHLSNYSPLTTCEILPSLTELFITSVHFLLCYLLHPSVSYVIFISSFVFSLLNLRPEPAHIPAHPKATNF